MALLDDKVRQKALQLTDLKARGHPKLDSRLSEVSASCYSAQGVKPRYTCVRTLAALTFLMDDDG